MLEAIVEIYKELGFESPDVIGDYANNCLTSNKTRTGREVLWYVDSVNNVAIYIDSLEFLTDEEIETELC